MFYFHGKTNEHFSLVSDTNLQINARFIGRRPQGRSRDNTRIQALGLMFNSHTLTLAANKDAKWDDQFFCTYNGKPIHISLGHLSTWTTQDSSLIVERTRRCNSVSITLPGVLGQTYRPEFQSPVKRGAPMPFMGGEDKFKTSSLVSANCKMIVDCSSRTSYGRGIVCGR